MAATEKICTLYHLDKVSLQEGGAIMEACKRLVEVDDVAAKKASDVLDALGITLPQYLDLCLDQVVVQQGLPFEPGSVRRVPNEKTRMAILRSEAVAAGLIPDESEKFTSGKALVDSIMSDGE